MYFIIKPTIVGTMKNNLEEGIVMLLEYTCSNYKSIKEKIVFSTIAGKDNQYAERLIPYEKYKVIRSSVIYGANGSGKTNVLSSLAFVKNLVVNSMNHQPGQRIFQAPHKLAAPETPSEFSMQFVKNGIRYAYGFSLLNNVVKEEYLYYFPIGKQVKIFDRDGLVIKPGNRYKKSFELSETVLKDNRLFLSCAANYSNLKEVEEAFLFFSQDIVFYNREVNNWIEYSLQLMQNNEQIKKLFVKMLQEFMTGIKDVRVKIEKVNLTEIQGDIPPELKPLLSGEANRIEAKVIYDNFETDLMTEESEGIKKLFELLCPIIDILLKGKILICDEIEKSLHENLVAKILELFQTVPTDKPAQIIFSTHDTSLLNSELFRRDQIWFTQLTEKERATDLYSLVEIKNVRKSENIGKGYVSGKYGAIPMMNPNFAEYFSKEF